MSTTLFFFLMLLQNIWAPFVLSFNFFDFKIFHIKFYGMYSCLAQVNAILKEKKHNFYYSHKNWENENLSDLSNIGNILKDTVTIVKETIHLFNHVCLHV